MTATRPPLIDPIDLAAAMGLMTRLPIPVNAQRAGQRGAHAAWAWPLAGALIGALAGGVFWAASALALPPLSAALLAVGTQILVTGALHEDGLADSADGLWGGWTRARRLEIMRDSRIGSYGVLALLLSVGLRVSCIAVLSPGFDALAVLMVSAMSSRAAMCGIMAVLGPARPDGLSVRVGRPRPSTAALAVLLAFGLAIALLPGAIAIALMGLCGLVTWAVGALAKVKLGGQTGDILGATQQITEIAGLLLLCTAL